jgi:hypothetical protein
VTTHLTHDDSVPMEEEPELVIIDDEEYEAAHRDDYADETGDEVEDLDGEDDEFEFSFEEDLDEAIALDLSEEMDPTVEDADDRMAGLFSSQREQDAADSAAPDDGVAGGGAAAVAAGSVALGASAAVPALSKQEARAEEKRQRENLKRRKEMDKAARLDDKERQREEKARAAAAEREAAAAQKDAAEAAKRQAAEAKRQAADAKTHDAAQAKRAAAEAKIRQAEERAEAKRSKAEAKRTKSEPRRRSDAIPAGLASFVVDEHPGLAAEPEPVAARTRKDVRVEKSEGTKRSLLVVVIVVLLVVVGVAAYAVTRPKAGTGTGAGTGVSTSTVSTGSGSGGSASALPAAVAATVSANTADVIYALDLSGSQPASINGGGSVDLATQGSNLSLTYSLGGQSFPEQIVYDGGQGFYDLGAIVHYVTPGYDWVSMDVGGAEVPGIGVGGVLADPSALVSLLQASASSAREIGHVQVDGAPATEYSIALNQAALTRVLATAGLPSFVRSASYTQLNEQAYVDSSGRVSRIVAVGTYPGSGHPMSASTTLDLSHYGTPVSVAPPPPPQVVPEQQFEASAAKLAHPPIP